MNKLVVVLLVVGIVVVAGFIALNPLSVLVLEMSYSISPVIVDSRLQDVFFSFAVDRYFKSVPTYQVMGGYNLASAGVRKLSLLDFGLNFTLDVDVVKGDQENGTVWRSVHLRFTTLEERKLQVYVQKPVNTTLGNNATIVVDARFVAWNVGQAPYIDKAFHKVFPVDIPDLT